MNFFFFKKTSHNNFMQKIKNNSFLKNKEDLQNFERRNYCNYYHDLAVDLFKIKDQEDKYVLVISGNLKYVSKFCSKEKLQKEQAFRNSFWEKEIEENEKKGNFFWGFACLYLNTLELKNLPSYFCLSEYSDVLRKNYSVSLTSVLTFSVSIEKDIKKNIGTLKNHFKKQFVIDSVFSKAHSIKHLTDMGIIEDEKDCFFIENSCKLPPILIEHVFRNHSEKTIVFYNKNPKHKAYIPQGIQRVQLKQQESEANETQSSFISSLSMKEKAVPKNSVFILSNPECCNYSRSSVPAIGYSNFLGLGSLHGANFFSELVEILHLIEVEKSKGCTVM